MPCLSLGELLAEDLLGKIAAPPLRHASPVRHGGAGAMPAITMLSEVLLQLCSAHIKN